MKLINGIFAVTLATAAAACGGGPDELPPGSEPVDVVVSLAVASPGVVVAPGTVVAEQQAELATRISGTIERMAVDIGSRVSSGDTLVVLDRSEMDARISGAQAAARLARQYHERIAALAADGAATPQELDDAKAKLEMAEAALRDARAQRQYVVLRAPFAGVITSRSADPGDLALPGMPVLELIGSTSLKIEADLPAARAGRLAVGDRIDVYRPETGARHSATVTRVVPAVERSSRRFRIEARFESPEDLAIAPGTFVRIEMGEPSAMTRWVPGDAIVTRGQLTGVFTVEHERLRLRWVRLGQRLGDAVELLAGPPTSTPLVRDPASALVDGQPVGNVSRSGWIPPFIDQPTASLEGER
ncbi:MAG: efflux RND transporter periplasmic adaptor subunit [Gemmatimonadota bacterium]|nr:MAG: efflux RND transporter periplasmic adaptor subunit [Gemmatimonadota bacterium]